MRNHRGSVGVVTMRSGRRVILTLPPRTHEQEARRRFLLAPIPIHIHTRSYPWAGVLIPNAIPESGRQVFAGFIEDEEYYARHAEEDCD